MAKQTINIGASPNDGTGTPLRTAFDYTNQNFTELYTATGPSGNNIVVPGNATITGDLTVDTSTLKVDSANNRVGIGTASPGVRVDILSDNNTSLAAVLRVNSNNAAVNTSLAYDGLIGSGAMTLQCGVAPFIVNTNGANERYRIASDGVATWSNVGGVAGTAMTLNATGLGIGFTPSAWGNASKVVQVGQAGSVYGRANLGYYGTKFNLYNDNTNDIAITNNFVGEYRFELLNGSHVWLNKSTTGTAGVNQTLTPAMTLTAGGDLLVGTTGAAGGRMDVQTATGNCTVRFKSNAAGSNVVFAQDYVDSFCQTVLRKSGTDLWSTGVINDATATPRFSVVNASSVGVYVTYGGTSWTATSDERLKDIIEPISNAVAKVGSLRSVIGKFKTDSEATRRSFLIAQDVQAVLPEAVDASNPDRLGVAYSEVIPLLVAAIKELTARVQTLEAK